MQIETNTPEPRGFSVPTDGMVPFALRNLIFMLHSNQLLLNHSAGTDFLCIPEALIRQLHESLPQDMDAFAKLLTDTEVRGFRITDGELVLLLPHSVQADRVAYENLFVRLVAAAKLATRVNPDLRVPESEKYSMYTLLYRLGYRGREYKLERRVLTKNLTGSAAFRNATMEKKHKERHAIIRKLVKDITSREENEE